jgi:DNA-directed RNA polymerase specialized sigma24 family protein
MTSNQHRSKAKNAASTPQLLSEAAKSAREATMATIVRLVDDKAAKSGGRVPYGFYPDVIQEFAKVVPNLTRAMIKHYRGKGKRRASDLTELDANATEATLSPTTVSNDLPQDDAGPPKKRQKGGRPKGTTIENSQEEIERYEKAVAEVAQDYKNALDDVEKQALHHSSGRRHIRKGTLDRIIEYAKKKHNVDHLEIPKEKIKSRVKRGRQWTKAKLKSMCLYKKVKGDKGLPDDGVAPSSLE